MWFRIVSRRLERALREYQNDAKTVSMEIEEYLNRNK